MSDQKQLAVKSAVDSWNSTIKSANVLFSSLGDEQFAKEVAPGKNRGIYLLGHLTAVNDLLLSLFGLGEQMYPQLNDSFLKKADKAVTDLPSAKELKEYWKNVNAALDKHFAGFTADDWFKKHTSVSEEDFAKEPHRNRLNVLLSRTNHLSYHLGQLALLKS